MRHDGERPQACGTLCIQRDFVAHSNFYSFLEMEAYTQACKQYKKWLMVPQTIFGFEIRQEKNLIVKQTIYLAQEGYTPSLCGTSE